MMIKYKNKTNPHIYDNDIWIFEIILNETSQTSFFKASVIYLLQSMRTERRLLERKNTPPVIARTALLWAQSSRLQTKQGRQTKQSKLSLNKYYYISVDEGESA